MSQATTSARQIAEDVATGVKVAVTEAVAWADKKVEELSERNEDIGPYGSSGMYTSAVLYDDMWNVNMYCHPSDECC
jgi:hypothetical protein